MKKHILLALALLPFLWAGAQTDDGDDKLDPEPRDFQITLVWPLGTNGATTNYVNNLSLNLIGGFNGGVDGAEVGGFANIIRYDVKGAQIAGFGNLVGEDVEGLQVAGFLNANRGDFSGVSAAGGVVAQLGDAKGVQAAGVAVINGGHTRGGHGAGFLVANRGDLFGGHGSGFAALNGGDLLGGQGAGFVSANRGDLFGGQGAGFASLNGGDLLGGQGAGFASLNGGNLLGGQGAGFLALSGGDFRGAQGAGFASINGGDFAGYQGAGFANINGGNFTGFQGSGFLNVAGGTLRGAQFGLINYADSIDKGASIGLINIVRRNGFRRVEAWGGDALNANIAFKSGMRYFYGILAAGAQFSDPAVGGVGAGFGSEFRLERKTFLGLDFLAYALADEDSEPQNEDENLNTLLQLRANVVQEVGKKVGFFVGPTANLLIADFEGDDAELHERVGAGYDIFDWRAGATYYRFWIGFNAGLRF